MYVRAVKFSGSPCQKCKCNYSPKLNLNCCIVNTGKKGLRLIGGGITDIHSQSEKVLEVFSEQGERSCSVASCVVSDVLLMLSISVSGVDSFLEWEEGGDCATASYTAPEFETSDLT